MLKPKIRIIIVVVKQNYFFLRTLEAISTKLSFFRLFIHREKKKIRYSQFIKEKTELLFTSMA